MEEFGRLVAMQAQAQAPPLLLQPQLQYTAATTVAATATAVITTVTAGEDTHPEETDSYEISK